MRIDQGGRVAGLDQAGVVRRDPAALAGTRFSDDVDVRPRLLTAQAQVPGERPPLVRADRNVTGLGKGQVPPHPRPSSISSKGEGVWAKGRSVRGDKKRPWGSSSTP